MTDLCTEIEKLGKGIGNASRYRLVQALLNGPKTVSELVKLTGFSQPLVSQHLRTLKECELVSDERKGQEVEYQVNSEYMLMLLKSLSESVQKDKHKPSE
ncbi:winged helix-turn-helix transcriptional regulator [Patescibacteria group bacterium]|nr:winged helix-turn-helix transcriptional regulator [Patescibacteria group bacterium]